MRKALKAATLMGLATALIVPAIPAKAADMDMGGTKISISGQLRQRLEWYANTIEGAGRELGGTYRARIQIKAELADGVTAVFTPQAVGVWGEGGQGLGLDSNSTGDVYMHEAYMLLANPFGIENVIVKMGRQEVNLGNQRLVGAVGWSQAGRSLDGILVGYVAGDYGLAGFFYGKLNDEATGTGPWLKQGNKDYDIDLYVATWQGNFKPFGFGGTYEITDIYVNPTTNYSKTLDIDGDGNADQLGIDINVNTLYGRVTPVFDTDFAKIKLNVEAAVQTGNADIEGGRSLDFNGYFFSIGGGATFADVTWSPDIFIGYDYYSGDDDPNDNDIDAFWSVLPTAHKWLGHADVVWVNTPFYQFNGKGLVNVILQNNAKGVQDLYFKVGVKPANKIAAHFDFHYFTAAEDVTLNDGSTDDSIGWETDLAVKYKYSKNLCLTLGWDHFDPDDAMEAVKGNDDSEDHFWLQADLKF